MLEEEDIAINKASTRTVEPDEEVVCQPQFLTTNSRAAIAQRKPWVGIKNLDEIVGGNNNSDDKCIMPEYVVLPT